MLIAAYRVVRMGPWMLLVACQVVQTGCWTYLCRGVSKRSHEFDFELQDSCSVVVKVYSDLA